jgi:hypothetical protein
MISLELFNGILHKESNDEIYVSDDGYIIEKGAMWAKDKIIEYYKNNTLDGKDLNKTFHKSWSVIKNSSRFELYLHQITHYLSTYGSDFKDEIYIPDEILDLPDIKLKYKVIKAYTKDELIDKCINLLNGVALKGDTLDKIICLLDELGFSFENQKIIKNKEAIVKIADLYGILPKDTLEFFRYIIYRSTDSTLLIKNNETIDAIKSSSFNPSQLFKKHGLIELSKIFNRFKPLFLAYKSKCPKVINKISKLSKIHHVPLIQNPLNNVTNRRLTDKDLHWLDNATPYALFKAILACNIRINGQDTFTYRIRNGKSWTMENKSYNEVDLYYNLKVIEDFLVSKYSLSGKSVYLPKNIEYALPTSEKLFVGNIPTGTKFYGKKLAVGVYWKNSWGARDLDISGINLYGKVGWNSSYNQDEQLFYSGDITNAPNGAVEYLYANKRLSHPTLVQNNVYNGNNDCEYKIVIGKGDNVNKDYMMNPNKLFAEIKCKSVQKQTVLGILLPYDNKQSFVLLNYGAGALRVSGNNPISELNIKALLQQYQDMYTFNKLLKVLGANIVDIPEDADYDFSMNNLTRTSFIELFKNKE